MFRFDYSLILQYAFHFQVVEPIILIIKNKIYQYFQIEKWSLCLVKTFCFNMGIFFRLFSDSFPNIYNELLSCVYRRSQ
jgi:hypothetical protein